MRTTFLAILVIATIAMTAGLRLTREHLMNLPESKATALENNGNNIGLPLPAPAVPTTKKVEDEKKTGDDKEAQPLNVQKADEAKEEKPDTAKQDKNPIKTDVKSSDDKPVKKKTEKKQVKAATPKPAVKNDEEDKTEEKVPVVKP